MTPEHLDRLRRINSCRQMAAWVKRPRRSLIRMTGADRIDLLHRLTTNDMRSLEPGSGQQTVLLTEKARIIDVVTVLQDAEDALLIGSRETASDILTWIRKYIITDDVRLKDVTDQMSIIEIMGPRAGEVTTDIVGIDVTDLAMSQWRKVPYVDGMFVVRVASPSELSYLIVGPDDTMTGIAEELSQHDADIPALSDELDEYVRVLAGMGRHGREWTLSYNPLEAGLLHLTSFAKGCYIGQEVIARLDSYNKVKQRVMGLVVNSEIALSDVIVADGQAVGIITSVVPSFDESRHMALGYVRGEFAHPGTTIGIDHRGVVVQAELILPPMVDETCP
jgi:folate-binding protein YgfZ